MAESSLLAIEHVAEHDIRGERRWTGRVVLPNGHPLDVLILRLRGGLRAIRNRCPHRDVALLGGRLDEEAGILECPSHGWQLPLTGSELRARPVIEKDGRFYLVYAAVSQ